MADPRGFLDSPRRDARKRDVEVRRKDFEEFVGFFDDAECAQQSARCMDCGVPFCMQGCPLGNRIPDFNELVRTARWREAWLVLDSTNNFPEFTGRLCPAPCEAACVLSVNQDPVTIEQIEKEIIERAFGEGWVTATPPKKRTGKTVAVVGSGPAGLAAAVQLNSVGHLVTVFERADRIGGLLRYGIPDFKMEKSVIDRRLELMKEEGVRFETNVDVGREPTWSALTSQHDAVVVAIGAMKPRDLDVPGRDASGVHFAMEYLEQQNRVVAGLDVVDPIDAAGKQVVILGGGDTGSDCFGTAIRQGAASVLQLELMPAPPQTRRADNPWPTWPHIFRTSSSQAEGGERDFAVKTKRVVVEAGRVVGIEVVRITVDDGAISEIANSATTIAADLLLLAMGFLGPAETDFDCDARGNIERDTNFATSTEGVFVAGDATRGASLIVWAISDGREAARNVDRFLQGETNLPTRGRDEPFEKTR